MPHRVAHRFTRAAWLAPIALLLVFPHAAAQVAPSPNLLPNGSFEDGVFAPHDAPERWQRAVYLPPADMVWDDQVARDGLRSIRITAPTDNDAAWTQTVTLAADTNYLLSGWIKTQDVAHTNQTVDAGANLCLFGTWQRTAALTGTNDWTYMRLVFNSGPTGTVTIGARLGYWAGMTSGTAWFDDLRVTEIRPSDPHPSWQILVLIYRQTDLTYWDQAAGRTRHVIGSLSDAQATAAAEASTRFVTTDIPALTSGQMRPRLTIRYPALLASLSPHGGGWWPSPGDTAPERDPAFDSVMVIWQPTVVDQDTGELLWIGSAAGLTPAMGTGQAYTTLIIEAAITYGHLNVFKHEWGHSILEYFDAAGTAPKPKVENHTDGTQYVHCGTGAPYVWADETDANPIPNSIYHNASGFTHDYYSGTTALATDPGRCLGITALAWATGGPVTKPGERPVVTPEARLAQLRASVAQLVRDGQLRQPWARPLEAMLDEASTALAAGDRATALAKLKVFAKHVRGLMNKGRIPTSAGERLIAEAGGIAAAI